MFAFFNWNAMQTGVQVCQLTSLLCFSLFLFSALHVALTCLLPGTFAGLDWPLNPNLCLALPVMVAIVLFMVWTDLMDLKNSKRDTLSQCFAPLGDDLNTILAQGREVGAVAWGSHKVVLSRFKVAGDCPAGQFLGRSTLWSSSGDTFRQTWPAIWETGRLWPVLVSGHGRWCL